VRERLAAELDGRRRPAEVRHHLRSCRDCRELSIALRDDRKTLRALDPAGGFKLLGLLLTWRGGRAALLGGVLVKGAAGGETGKLAALCLAAVCATAGVQEVRTSLPADNGASRASAAADRSGAGATHARATSAATAAGPPGAIAAADRRGAGNDAAAKPRARREATMTATGDRAASPTEPESRSEPRPDNGGRGRARGRFGDRGSEGARSRGGERARPLTSRAEGGRRPEGRRQQGPSDGTAGQPATAPWSGSQPVAPSSDTSSRSGPRPGGPAAGGDRRGPSGQRP
jgi:hypothetical protein